MTDLGQGKNIVLPKKTVLPPGKFLSYGAGAHTSEVLWEFNNGEATLPSYNYNTDLAGLASFRGIEWITTGAINTGMHWHSTAGAVDLIQSTGSATETLKQYIGQLSTGSISSGTRKLWVTEFDSPSFTWRLQTFDNGTTVNRMSGNFSTGVFSVDTANYSTLVTADEHIPNKKYVDDSIPVKETFSTVATAAQTVFPLPSTPDTPGNVTAFRNGVEAENGVNFTVSGSTLTWVTPTLVVGERISGFYNETGISDLVTVITETANAIAALGDNKKVIEFTNGASDFSWTIAPNVDVSFPTGSFMEVRKTGTGEITVTKGAGVTFRTVLGDVNFKIDGADGFSVFAEKTAVNTWLFTGAIKAV